MTFRFRHTYWFRRGSGPEKMVPFALLDFLNVAGLLAQVEANFCDEVSFGLVGSCSVRRYLVRLF